MSKLKVVERLKMIQKRIEELSSKQVVVGSLNDSTRKDGLSNADLLAIHEFGSVKQGIPERPVMRTSLKKSKQGAQKLLSKSVSECLNGNISADRAYEEVGRFLKAMVINTFVENEFEPLKPATVKRKKSTGTLIDTGALRASINYEVRNRG